MDLMPDTTFSDRAWDRRRWLILGVPLVSGALFCLVYGFSNAGTHNWVTPSTCGFLAAGVALGVGFALWQGRAAQAGASRERAW
jgi:hypothetical protein